MTTQPSDWAVARAFREIRQRYPEEGVADRVLSQVETLARELDASGGGPKPIAWMDNHGEVIGADVLEAYRQAHGDGPASCYRIPLYATPRAAEAGDALDAARWRAWRMLPEFYAVDIGWIDAGEGRDAAIDALGD